MKILSGHPIAMRYHTLGAHDKRSLLILGVFLAAVTLWKGIWLPLDNAVMRYREEYTEAASDYAWMKAHAPHSQASPDNNFISKVTSSASLFQVNISSAQPVQNNAVQVIIVSVPFNSIISWLELLQREHGIKATRIMLEKSSNSPGHVSAQLTLEPSNF